MTEVEQRAGPHRTTVTSTDRPTGGPVPHSGRFAGAVDDVPVPPPGYRLEHLLGRGGQAQVWAARQIRLDLPVALKFWPATLDQRQRHLLRREVEALRELVGHPAVVRLLDTGTGPDAAPWLATELCDGSLAAALRSGGIPVAQAFGLADDVLAGLSAVHRAGHLHRDVKPANVLLHHGRAKLCDLGLTGRIDRDTSLHFCGTAPFVAPELRTGQPTVASDLYAAGHTLEMLFEAAYRPGPLPPELDDLLVRTTSSRPGDRPADAETLRAAVARIGSGASPAPATGGAGEPAPAGLRRRDRLVAATGGAMVTAALTVLVLVAVDRWDHPASGPGRPLTAAGPVDPAPAGATPLPSPPTRQIENRLSRQCVDVRGPLPDDGTPLQLWDCINVSEERWIRDGARLRGFAGKCIGLPGDDARDGTPVALFTCADHPRQQWRPTPGGQLRGLHGKCLEAREPLRGNGTPLQIATCADVPRQIWRFF